MGHDFSRINHDPWNDYLGVLLQQGRPLTDADWNAFVSAISRRVHAGALDTVGAAVVPGQTPDAFKIVAVAGGLTIGVGRIYIDGLLAENHGQGERRWEPHLAELRGEDPVPYDAQPYLPRALELPTTAPYIVYVDVFQREVGPLQDSRLIDKALGVDTAVRLQTVWQVRTLAELATGTKCSTPLQAIEPWTRATAPSAGRLTTATGEVKDEPDPCLVAPAGGYKGAENQLYRVEVHEGGSLGEATFKWSRDNASIQARVLRLPDLTHVVLDSIGKDDVLRFSGGNWIEIVDDALELAGGPGLLRRIALDGVDEATHTLTLMQPLPATAFSVDANGTPTSDLHLRAKRWDQSGRVKRTDGSEYTDLDAAGDGHIVIPSDGTQLLLENGVLVSFGLSDAGGVFRPGDFWTFAARAADASLELLEQAPPQGIHHHYAKLAVVTPTEEGLIVEDCRKHWPPASCCTIVVRPGEDIQHALDSLPTQGGCVCLKAGEHFIESTLHIARPHVLLHGESPGARIRAASLDAMLELSEGATDITVERIEFELDGATDEDGNLASLVVVRDCERVRLTDCSLRYSGDDVAGAVLGVALFDSSGIEIRGCRIEDCDVGAYLQGDIGALTMAENVLRGTDGRMQTGLVASGGVAFAFRNNDLEGVAGAVLAAPGRAEAVITDNVIRRAAPQLDGADDADPDRVIFAINVARDGCVVRGNDIDVSSPVHGGIRAGGMHCEIADNRIAGGFAAYGVYVSESAFDKRGADFTRVTDNRLSGEMRGIALVGVHGGRVMRNHILGRENRTVAVSLVQCEQTVIGQNQIEQVGAGIVVQEGVENRLVDNTIRTSSLGIFAKERSLEVIGNRVEDSRGGGISIYGTSARIVNNHTSNCGYSSQPAYGIVGACSTETSEMVTCESCAVLNTGISPNGERAQAAVGIMLIGYTTSQLSNCRVAYEREESPDQAASNIALVLDGPQFDEPRAKTVALVTGNSFAGPGETFLVRIGAAQTEKSFTLERLTFSNNHCLRTSKGPENGAVLLSASRAIVMGNHIDSKKWGALITAGRVMFVGNSSNAPIDGLGPASTVPLPPEAFNDLP